MSADDKLLRQSDSYGILLVLFLYNIRYTTYKNSLGDEIEPTCKFLL